MANTLSLDGHSLTIEEVVAVARDGRAATLHDAARDAIRRSHEHVQSLLQPGAPPIYGINTGFGVFVDRTVAPADAARLSRNLILSHAVGVGDPFPDEVVRAAMLIRANTLASGYSGVRIELIETLLAMLAAGVHPEAPQQGSLGSSGDLAPLSHLALVFTTDMANRIADSGWARYNGRRMRGAAAMQQAGLKRHILGAKEGLALNNGATFSAAVAALAVRDAENLVANAEVALALALEALLGVSAAFDERLHAARRHAGQSTVAERVRALTRGSTLLDSTARVQDAYSLRCAPQILGPVRDLLALLRKWVEDEINAATDNPLLFADDHGEFESRSGGNFHGEVLGLAMDYLGIAVSELAALAERQTARLVTEEHSYGLPPMLVGARAAAGLNSGLMMPHYTAASLALEAQALATPSSVQSLPTSAGQEDVNANALTAARHARQIVANAEHILAIEFYSLAQAMDLRLELSLDAKPAAPTAAVHARLREEFAFVETDRLFGPEIERVRELVHSGELVRVAREKTAPEPKDLTQR